MFVGDTLFAMGCGRLFEGDAPTMWNSVQKIMAMPGDTEVFCAHEYTQTNARFALSVGRGGARVCARGCARVPPEVFSLKMRGNEGTCALI